MRGKHLARTAKASLAFVAVVNCWAFFLTGPPTGAQALGFVPGAGRAGKTVSVRELHISAKARGELERGVQRLAKPDPAGSLRHFLAAIHASPGFYEAYYYEGLAESQLGRNDQALRAFQTAIDLSDGRFPRAEFAYALTLCRTGNASDAERVVRHGLETDPTISDGHVVLGVVLLTLNRFDEAEKSGLQALRLNDPDSAEAHLVLADVYGARADFDGQVRELSEYLERCPKNHDCSSLRVIRDMAKGLGERAKPKQVP
jgi:tetratricopeptide (TPR) repeat protein